MLKLPHDVSFPLQHKYMKHIWHHPLGSDHVSTNITLFLQHHLKMLSSIHRNWQMKGLWLVSAVTIGKMVFFNPSPIYLFSEYTFWINRKKKNLFQYDRPPTTISNRAPLRPLGRQPVKVNGEEEVTNCFIQSPPLSASAVKNRTLDDFRS